MSKDTALRLAMEALEVANSLVDGYYLEKGKAWLPEIEEAITAIKAALETNDEPVAWYDSVSGWTDFHSFKPTRKPSSPSAEWLPLYAAPPQRKPLTDERLELIGHADLAINNIYIFNGYGEDVPEGRTPIYAGYKAAHGIKGEA